MKVRERVLRGIATGFTLLLVLVYFLVPIVEEDAYSDSGREKWELTPGETFQWNWTPASGNPTALDLSLSGVKKAAGTIVFAQILDESEDVIASAEETIADPFEGQGSLRLEGSFLWGKTYMLQVRAEGDGILKLKGRTDEETGEFHPSVTEYYTSISRNPVLLYFAAGALLAALTPVRKRAGGNVPREIHRRSALERILPWAVFLWIAALGIWITLQKSPEKLYSWDEKRHLEEVQLMSLFQFEGIRTLVMEMITWAPGYVPLAIGYNLAQIFTADEAILYHSAVCCQSLFYAGMVALSVRHAPRYKATFLVAGTLPTLLFLMSSVTYDIVVTGSVLLGLALVMETAEGKAEMTPARGITLISLMAFGTVAKPAYSLILMSLWMIPRECFDGKRQAWIFRAFALLMLIWCLLAVVMPGAYDDVRTGDVRFEDTDTSRQIAYMLAHPIEGGLKPVFYVISNWDFLATGGIAHWAYLGGNPQMNLIFLWLLLVTAPLGTMGETWKQKSPLFPGRRIGLALIAFGAEVMVAYGQFLASTRPGGDIDGMQARYFIPVWIAMALALMWPQRIRQRMGKAGPWITIIVCLISMIANVLNALRLLPVA